jgi:hypothetical protein
VFERLERPPQLHPNRRRVTGDRGQTGVGARLEAGDLALAGAHPPGQLRLGQPRAAAPFGQLPGQFSPFQCRGHSQRDRRVVLGELVDQLVEIVLAGHRASFTRHPI